MIDRCAALFALILCLHLCVSELLSYFQGSHQPGKPGKVREFDSGQGKVRESGKSQGKCVLRVGCYRFY